MKRILCFIIWTPMMLLVSCDVHEWPDLPNRVPFHLRLVYETDMTEWKHLYNGLEVREQGLGEMYDNRLGQGKIRYVIRAYPVSEMHRVASIYAQEFVFTKDISEGYEHEVTLSLPEGDYNVMVWSDLMETVGDTPFHDAANFNEIKLQGDHQGNTDYRDAFRGTNRLSLVADVRNHQLDTVNITMQRPLAKIEFVTNDVEEFIKKESVRVDSRESRTVNLEDYKVAFHYVGFMADTYSMYTDKPVDSSTGVMFESTLTKLNDKEASMGFDYVLANDKETTVTMQMALYDKKGTQVSLTKLVDVPVKRSRHTLLTGTFLISEATGGVTINPSFNGDHNIKFE